MLEFHESGRRGETEITKLAASHSGDDGAGKLMRCPLLLAHSMVATNLGCDRGSSSACCNNPQLPHLLHFETLEK